MEQSKEPEPEQERCLEVGYSEIKDQLTADNLLGSGAFGSVFRVRWRGQVVAVKLLHKMDPYALKSFERDFHNMMNFASPFLITFKGACTKGPYALIMEYADGGSLKDLLMANRRGLPLSQVIKFVANIMGGLAYMHQRNIIHRDLKPDNILLLQPLHGDLQVKLTDFGCSTSSTNYLTTYTGTWGYMAPEMLVGRGAYNEQVDIYSFSLILFQMLFGTCDYLERARDVSALPAFARFVTAGGRPLIPKETVLPFSLHDLLVKCWHEDPAERPTAAAALEMLWPLIETLSSETAKQVEACRRVRLRDEILRLRTFGEARRFEESHQLHVCDDAESVAEAKAELAKELGIFLQVPVHEVLREALKVLEDRKRVTEAQAKVLDRILALHGNLPQEDREEERLFNKETWDNLKLTKDRIISKHGWHLLVVGDTNSGKTTILNILLGIPLLPAIAGACTKVLCEIRYGEKKRARLYCRGTAERAGEVEKISLDCDDPAKELAKVLIFDPTVLIPPYEKVVVSWPSPLLKLGMVLVDSRGVSEDIPQVNTNTIEELKQYFPYTMAVMVILNTAENTITERFGELLRHLRSADSNFLYKRVFFVGNKYDQPRKRKETEESVIENFRHLLQRNWGPGFSKEIFAPLIADEPETPDNLIYFIDFTKRLAAFLDNTLGAHQRHMNDLCECFLHQIGNVINAHWNNSCREPEHLLFYQTQLKQLRIELRKLLELADRKGKEQLTLLAEQLRITVSMHSDQIVPRAVRLLLNKELLEPPEKEEASQALVTSLQEFLGGEDILQLRMRAVQQVEEECKPLYRTISFLVELLERSLYGRVPKQDSILSVFSRAGRALFGSLGFLRGLVDGIGTGLEGVAMALVLPISVPLTLYRAEQLENNAVVFRRDKKAYLQKWLTQMLLDFIGQKPLAGPMNKVWNQSTAEVSSYPLLVKSLFPFGQLYCKYASIADVFDRAEALLPRLTKERPEQVQQIYKGHLEEFGKILSELATIQLRNFLPDRITDVRILDLLNPTGATAHVYKGTCSLQGGGPRVEVALKVMKDAELREVLTLGDTDPVELIPEFVREVTLMRRLQHKNVVTCLGWFASETDGMCRVGLVLELCEGSLWKFLKMAAWCPNAAILDPMLQIAQGMEYLHSEFLLHKDLKPSNILVQGNTIKIGDVGLAKTAKAFEGFTARGTEDYQPPELKMRLYGLSLDVWSYGIVLWEMWYRKKYKRRHQEGLTFDKKPTIPEALKELIISCVDVQPLSRPTFAVIVNTLSAIKEAMVAE